MTVDRDDCWTRRTGQSGDSLSEVGQVDDLPAIDYQILTR
jgi:hypothetical protein